METEILKAENVDDDLDRNSDYSLLESAGMLSLDVSEEVVVSTESFGGLGTLPFRTRV
jgi:hypothetical protein